MAEAMGQMAAAPAPTEEAALPNVVPVLFRVAKRHVPFGQQFAVVGSVKELGEWDATKAVKLEWHEGDDWLATVRQTLLCCYVLGCAFWRLGYVFGSSRFEVILHLS